MAAVAPSSELTHHGRHCLAPLALPCPALVATASPPSATLVGYGGHHLPAQAMAATASL